MRMRMKVAAAALGWMLAAVGGMAQATTTGNYDDGNGGCTAGTYGGNDLGYDTWAYYDFPAMHNGGYAFVQGLTYDRYGRVSGYVYDYFDCSNGSVSYNGTFQDLPSWD